MNCGHGELLLDGMIPQDTGRGGADVGTLKGPPAWAPCTGVSLENWRCWGGLACQCGLSPQFASSRKKKVNIEGALQGSWDCEDAQEPADQKGFGSPPGQCHCLLLSDTVCRLLDFLPGALDV